MAELLDEIKKMDSSVLANAIYEAPDLLRPVCPGYGHWQDAYLGAAAEHIARSSKIDVPAWTEGRERFLSKAWFDNQGLNSLNALMVAESPLSFRRRFIFTEAKPLRRA